MQQSLCKDNYKYQYPSLCSCYLDCRNPGCIVSRREKCLVSKRIAYNDLIACLDLLYAMFVYISNILGEDAFSIEICLQAVVEIFVCLLT